jgi:hypothetical protein
LKLPADQWMQLAVFIDGSLDASDKTGFFEQTQMFLEIKWRAASYRARRPFVRDIVHAPPK